MDMTKTPMEHKYTSTGIKFWRHRKQMEAFRAGKGYSSISTHISPEGTCNLNCSYCSVKQRNIALRIPLETIKDYITKLKSRGLKAVILTGGGEPTIYPKFNELVDWIKNEQKLSVSLITNGTQTHRVKPETWKAFSWVRVSINDFPGWEEKITLPTQHLAKDCIVGSSLVYLEQPPEFFEKVTKIANKINAKYIRLLPNCLLEQEQLLKQHEKLDQLYKKLDDKRYFHQHKIHETPNTTTCHQAYFRPYLSEVGGGTVYPCDSVVLNDCKERFAEEYQICKASEILDFLDRKIKMKFNPQTACTGCVFSDNIKLLEKWKRTGENRYDEFKDPLMHEEFV